MRATTLIGLDCATQATKIGVARGSFAGGRLTVHELYRSTKRADLLTKIAGWIQAPTLLAVDAPLGWPQPLGEALATHQAGAPLEIPTAADGFSRMTDRIVWKRAKYRPLDVGADRIARTAHAALDFVAALCPDGAPTIPLAWAPNDAKVSMIEVYPAATLQARGLSPRGYKGCEPGHGVRRAALLDALRSELILEVEDAQVLASDHALDAVLCLLAGADFLRGQTLSPSPSEVDRARREGWIWFRPPGVDAS